MARFVEVLREVRRGFPIREIQESLRKQEGLRDDQVDVLTILSTGLSGGQRMGDVSRRLHVHHTNIARTVQSLVAANYVERMRSEADGRVVIVSLTSEGKAVADRLRERRNVYLSALLEEFPSEDEKEELIHILERLAMVLANVASNLIGRS